VLDARRRPSRLCFSHFATRTVDNTVDLYAVQPDIRPESRLGGEGFRRNIAILFGMEKLEWIGYPMVKNFEDIFIRFDASHERDRQTGGQTPHDDIGRAYASHRAAKMSVKTTAIVIKIESLLNSLKPVFHSDRNIRIDQAV